MTNGVITITTAGGSFVYDSQAINVLPEVITSGDQGETLSTALAVNVPTNSQVTLDPTIGDGGFGARDVDIFRIEANSGQRLSIDVARLPGTGFLYVRLFDSLGNELAADGFANNSSPQLSSITIPESGTYYVGVSGFSNTDYDPTIVGSGSDGGQGAYELTIERRDAGSTRLESITATADSGTPTNANIAAANSGQTITLSGVGLTSNERVVFTAIDASGDLFFRTVTPVSVASDGSSLEVVVPIDATSGVVRVSRENTGLFLQVVPTLTDVDQGAGDSFHNGNLRLTGSAFADGATTINFGNSPLNDPNQAFTVLDVFTNNTGLNVVVPNGVPSGPLSVTTLGGTSEVFGLGFNNIVSTADSGTAADGAVASANPGQAITLQGTNFDLTTDVVFLFSDSNGTRFERIVRPTAVNDDGTEIMVTVPTDAVTGPVRIVGDMNATDAPLQIVPTISVADLTSVNINDAFFSLTGTGFIEGPGTQYTFGSQSLIDVNASFATGDVFSSNTRANVNLPYAEDLFGLVTVTTEGGTSAPFSIGLTQIDSVAFSGTAADTSEASANADQAISILGSNLNTATDFVVRYLDDSGNLRNVLVNPVSASADGTEATLELPAFANSAFGLQAVGASAQPLLQIVPTLSTIDVAGNDFIRVDGTGIAEGDGAYNFNGTVVTDPDASGTNVNVSRSGTRVDLNPVTNFGAGTLTLTTAGGTSEALPYNFTNANLSTLFAVEQGDNGESFVIASSRVQRVDANGLLLQTYDNATTSFGGLSRLTQPLILRNSADSTQVTLPAGTLLVLKTNDIVDALDPATDTVLASFDPGPNISSPIGLALHPTTNTLFFLDGSADQVIEIDPATGGELSRFAAGVDTSDGGITVGPDGNLWIVGDVNNNLVQLQTDGTLLQTIDLTSQGIDRELSGIDFIDESQFLASSTRGVIYQLTINPTTTAAAVLTDINGLAADGTPADGVQASANIGEAIELVGTDLTVATPIVFPIRNIDGSVGSVTVTPTAVNSDGTLAQVIVPDLATTGDILIGGSGSGSQLLQIVPVITGISGRQGTNGTFDLFGSGFMEGASTISTGGTVFEDVYTNPSTDDVFGARNSQYRLSLANATEGPITITTAGGTFTFGGPSFEDPAFVDLIDVQTSTVFGTPTDVGQAATHAGELLTLTGRGLTNNTVVQFDAVDQNGQTGTLSRTGSASSDGTSLTIVVPAQAVTGNLRVVGDTQTIIPLQIVPVLRSVGGQITAGNQIVLEGVGLPEGDLTITIDGQTVLDQDVLTILERRSSQSNHQAQQIVNLTVPTDVTNGVITITTAGGSFVYDSQAINVLPEVITSGDQGETLSTALAVNVPTNSQVTLDPTIGDGGFGARDVDIFRIEANSGQRLSIDVARLPGTGFLYVRLFDSLGNELAADGFANNSSPQLSSITIPESGTYYVGVSGFSNTDYDPTIVGSGSDGGQGAYELTIERRDAGSTRLESITATADSGTPTNANIAAANSGQTITLSGVGLTSNERVVFTAIDASGDLFFRTVTPVSVASDGSSLEVVVPIDATSGVVRVSRENTGLFLQVVPTLTDVDQGAGDSFHNGNLRLTGSAFADGATTINFGSSPLNDPNQAFTVLDVFTNNTGLNVVVPNGVPSGPLSVTTLGWNIGSLRTWV